MSEKTCLVKLLFSFLFITLVAHSKLIYVPLEGSSEGTMINITISKKEVSVYEVSGEIQTFIQRISFDSQVSSIFMLENLMLVEEEDHFLTIYKLKRKELQNVQMNKKALDFQIVQKIRLNGQQKLQNIKLSQNREIVLQYERRNQKIYWPTGKQSNQENKLMRKKQKESEKIKNQESLKKHSKERIMQEVTLTFQQAQQISIEGSNVQTVKLKGDFLLYTGITGVTKVREYNGSQFELVHEFPSATSGQDVECDEKQQMYFEGNGLGIINYYLLSSGQLTLQDPIQGVKKSDALNYIELYEDYLLASFWQQVILYKKNADTGQFTIEQNLNIPDRNNGIKWCDANTILAINFQSIDGTEESVFTVYRKAEGQFSADPAQKIKVGRSVFQNSFAVTDDCSTVIVSPRVVPPDGGHLMVWLKKNQEGKYTKNKQFHMGGDQWFQPPCIHPEGYIIGVSRSDGVDIWLRNPEGNDYSYVSNIGFFNTASCDIDDRMIVMGGYDQGKVGYKLHNLLAVYPPPPSIPPSSGIPGDSGTPEQFGQFSIGGEQPQQLTEANRKIIGIKKTGEDLVVIEQYSGAKTYEKSGESYSLNENLIQSKFFSSVDADSALGLLILGSYDKKLYIFEDQGEGFPSVTDKFVQTSSQILALDFSDGERLLAGHMDGSISKHLWDDGSSAFTSQEGAFSSEEGTRVYGVKGCPDGSALALREKLGWFHLIKIGADGEEKFSNILEEFIQATFEVSEDCSRVFIANNMLGRVEIFDQKADEFSLFQTIQLNQPLGDIAINPDANVFVVNKHKVSMNVVYKQGCDLLFEQRAEISGQKDDYSAEMTDTEIFLGAQDGTVRVFSYANPLEVCDPFGKKTLSEITDFQRVEEPTRAITSLDVSGSLTAASSKYSGLFVFQIPGQGGVDIPVHNLDDSIFISSVSVAPNTIATGTASKSILIYTVPEGESPTNPQNISTEAQVSSVHLPTESRLLAGMINGKIIQFSLEAASSSIQSESQEENSQVYGVRLCPDDSWIVLLEKAGIFTLKTFFINDANTRVSEEISTGLEDELIEAYLDTSPDCRIIAMSGVTMQKVEVYEKGAESYEQLDIIDFETPLSQVSLEEDGDLLIVPSITKKESYVYHHRQCQEGDTYQQIKKLESGDFDEATAITGEFILQGNENGDIKISQYSWEFEASCLPFEGNIIGGSSSPIRSKESPNSIDFKKIVGQQTEQILQSKSSLSQGIIILIVLGSFAITCSLTAFICLNSKKSKMQPNSDKTETVKELESVAE